MQHNRPQEQNANGKRVQKAVGLTTVAEPQPKRNRLPEPARRPDNPYRRRRGPDKAKGRKLFLKKDPFTPSSAAAQQNDFEAVKTPGDQRVEIEARQRPGRMDSTDQALLASGLRRPQTEEKSRRNVRNKKIRSWDDQVVPASPPRLRRSPLGEEDIEETSQENVDETSQEVVEETSQEDISMSEN